MRLAPVVAITGSGAVEAARIGFREYGTYGIAIFGLALAAMHVKHPQAWRVANVASIVGMAVVILGVGLLTNPLHFNESVGSWPVLNALLWSMGIPAALAALIAKRMRERRLDLAGRLSAQSIGALGSAATDLGSRTESEKAVSRALAIVSLILIFALVSLMVRQFFVGGDLMLANRPFGDKEWTAYSVAWLILGAALLAAGIWTGRSTFRYGSLAVLLLAVGKVFLLDTRHLDGLLRAGSFLGLGLTLMGLGYVYQRFVFGPTRPKISPADASNQPIQIGEEEVSCDESTPGDESAD